MGRAAPPHLRRGPSGILRRPACAMRHDQHQKPQGPGVPEGWQIHWLTELGLDGSEVHCTALGALVVVDRDPCAPSDAPRGHRVQGPVRLSLVEEVREEGEGLLLGRYSGLLGGTAVMMHQYVRIRNGVPDRVVRVIARINGPIAGDRVDERAMVLALMEHPGPGRRRSA